MPTFSGDQWFRDNINPYLTIIKTQLATLGNVTGQYSGKGATFAALPSLNLEGVALSDGDWVVLTSDDVGTGTIADPQYPAGTYLKEAAGFALLAENADIANMLVAIIATDPEVVAGTATDKVPTVDQVKRYYAKLGGIDTQVFLVGAAAALSNEALNANQFVTAITATEAQADWTAA